MVPFLKDVYHILRVGSVISVPLVGDAVCVSDGGERVFSRGCLAYRDHIVLSSMEMMFSASIGVDVNVTGVMGVVPVFFNIGEGRVGSGIISFSGCTGFCTWILNERELVSYKSGSAQGSHL